MSRSPRSHLARPSWPPLVFGVGSCSCGRLAVKVFDFKPYFLPAASRDLGGVPVDNTAFDLGRHDGLGPNALIGLVVGHGARRVDELPADAGSELLNDLVTRSRSRLNAMPIFVLVVGVQQHVRDDERGPAAADGHADRVLHRVGERRQGTARRSMPTQLELMRSYAASESAILRKVRVPNAVPYLFTALKIAAPAAVITAFVSEYFGGTQNGWGAGSSATSPSRRTRPAGRTCSAPACSV